MRVRSLIFFALFMGASCTSALEKRVDAERFYLKRIAIDTLRFRRPDRPVFDEERVALNPHLAPVVDEKDERTYDCEIPREVMARGLDLKAVHTCFQSLNTVIEIRYLLEWDEKNPRYVLQKPEKAPPCIQQSLKAVEVPREVIYQDLDGCYAQRLDPKKAVELRVKFPLESLGKTPDATYRQLLGWVMSAFYDTKAGAFPGFYVSRRTCDRCAPGVKAHPQSTWW